MSMLKKLFNNYRMRKLRKYYIDYTMKHLGNNYNAFSANNGNLDEIAIKYIENLCDYIVNGIR